MEQALDFLRKRLAGLNQHVDYIAEEIDEKRAEIDELIVDKNKQTILINDLAAAIHTLDASE